MSRVGRYLTVDDLVRVVHRLQAASCKVLSAEGVDSGRLLEIEKFGEEVEKAGDVVCSVCQDKDRPTEDDCQRREADFLVAHLSWSNVSITREDNIYHHRLDAEIF